MRVFLQSRQSSVLRINGGNIEESTNSSRERNKNVYKLRKEKESMTWEIKKIKNAKVKNPIVIEGLPGIGNVGKIAADFLIDALKAKKIYEVVSNDFPHCVFVNENNLVELPSIEIYHKELGNRSLLILAGDVQPLTEVSCYEFCNSLLDTFQKENVQEIITLGGIALQKIPVKPRVHCTGNSKKIVQKYLGSDNDQKAAYGFVGPIIGVSGVLPGLAGKRNIPSATLLAETFGHPNYIGVRGAKELLRVLNKELNLKLRVDDLNEEMESFEKEFMNIKKIKKALAMSTRTDQSNKFATDYIG